MPQRDDDDSAFEQVRKAVRRLFFGLRARIPREGRRRLVASDLFDAEGYLTHYPDVRESGIAPLDHFILYGWKEGRDPNSMFDVSWYLSNNPDVRRAGANPLLHYVLKGEREGRPPSKAFSPRYHVDRYPDVAHAPDGLLSQYLTFGRREEPVGVLRTLQEAGEDVTSVEVTIVKELKDARKRRVALLVCRAAEGQLHHDVVSLMEYLSGAGYDVVLIVCSDAPFQIKTAYVERVAGIYLRRHIGLAFEAWAHLLRLEPSLFAAERLILADVSLLRVTPEQIVGLLKMLENVGSDLTSLTEGYDPEWHITADLMLLKPTVLASVAFQRFVFSIRAENGCEADADRYRYRFASVLRKAHLRCEVLYPDPNPSNARSVRGARQLSPVGAYWVSKASSPTRSGAYPCGAEGWRHSLSFSATSDQVLSVDFMGVWWGPQAESVFGRRLIEGLWGTGFLVNLRPIFDNREREVIDFDGAANVAIVQLVNGESPPRLEPSLQVVARRAGALVGVSRDGVHSAWPEADVIWTPSAPITNGSAARPPVVWFPQLAEGDCPSGRLAELMAQRLSSLIPPRGYRPA